MDYQDWQRLYEGSFVQSNEAYRQAMLAWARHHLETERFDRSFQGTLVDGEWRVWDERDRARSNDYASRGRGATMNRLRRLGIDDATSRSANSAVLERMGRTDVVPRLEELIRWLERE